MSTAIETLINKGNLFLGNIDSLSERLSYKREEKIIPVYEGYIFSFNEVFNELKNVAPQAAPKNWQEQKSIFSSR